MLYMALYTNSSCHISCFSLLPHVTSCRDSKRNCALWACSVYVFILCVYVCVLWGANCSWAATAKQQQQQQQQWLVVVCKSSFKINADCRNKRRSEQLTWNQSKGSTSKRSSAKAKKTKWWGGGGGVQESLAATVAEQLQWQWQQKCTEMDRQNAHITRIHIHAVLCWLHTNLHVNMYVKHTHTHTYKRLYIHMSVCIVVLAGNKCALVCSQRPLLAMLPHQPRVFVCMYIRKDVCVC